MHSELLTEQITFVFQIIFGILVFFSILFLSWKKISPGHLINNIWTRTWPWWIIAGLYFVFFCLNFYLCVVGFLAVSVLGLREFVKNMPDFSKSRSTQVLALVAIIIQFLIAATGSQRGVVLFLPTVFFFAISVLHLINHKKVDVFPFTSKVFFLTLLVSFGISHLVLLLRARYNEALPSGPAGLILYYFFLTQFNDVLQFLSGKLFGRHAIFQGLTNKTLEGLVGGMILTTGLAALFRFMTPLSFSQALLTGLILSITGFFGDIEVSAIKRHLNIKDLGSLIPGHGGIMDRVDSLLFSSFVFYYLLVIFNIIELPF